MIFNTFEMLITQHIAECRKVPFVSRGPKLRTVNINVHVFSNDYVSHSSLWGTGFIWYLGIEVGIAAVGVEI